MSKSFKFWVLRPNAFNKDPFIIPRISVFRYECCGSKVTWIRNHKTESCVVGGIDRWTCLIRSELNSVSSIIFQNLQFRQTRWIQYIYNAACACFIFLCIFHEDCLRGRYVLQAIKTNGLIRVCFFVCKFQDFKYYSTNGSRVLTCHREEISDVCFP